MMDPQTRARFAQAAFSNGLVARNGKHHAEAARHFQMAHIWAPESPEPLMNLGNALRDLGDLEGAAQAWRDAITVNPAHHPSLANLAVALSDLDRNDDALAVIQGVLTLTPDWFNAIANIEAILRAMGRNEESARWAQRQVYLWPDDYRGHMSMAATLHRDGQPKGAINHQQKAAVLAPKDVHVMSALAILHQETGDSVGARNLFDWTLKMAPDDPGVKWNTALSHLNDGDLETGWELYEARFAAGTTARRRHLLPPHLRDWAGQAMAHGERLLVWREQGVGDEIMWASCYPHLPAGSIVECTPRLHSLFARSFPHLDIRPELNGELPHCAYHIAAGSLPRIFRRSLGDFQGGGYLLADKARWNERLWRDKSDPLGQERTAISWRSMRSRTGQTARGYPQLSEWVPFKDQHGYFVSAQYDNDPPDDLKLPGFDMHNGLPKFDLKNDFEALAAMLSKCESVISVGNTVAALAGALGVPTAMLMLEGDYTMLGSGSYPWASSVKCFVKRADEPDWSRQMAEIATWLRTI